MIAALEAVKDGVRIQRATLEHRVLRTTITPVEWVEHACGRWLHEECIDFIIQDADGQERLFLFLLCILDNTALCTTNLLMIRF